ncbi:intermembrane transport protein PqiB [Thiolinea disciformis]|uniref:PqiB family protein n=1 Tax=Thiolinea disciformis TaxID=125614 RepID=UPI00036ED913|nr:MlaD family protein [Thiolinea disciformis]
MDNNHLLDMASLPEVRVKRQRWPSPVWLIPLAAALIGLWLLATYWYNRGDTIVVRFPSAENIEPGSTRVRYKAVTVGKVERVTLDENLQPLVELALNKEISNALKCSAKFWVVRPRIKGTEISGLGTLFSGSYVGMIPAQEEETTGTPTQDPLACYQALEGPPPTRPARAGREYKLVTDTMGSLDIGTPIFYKQLQVGEVIDYKLKTEGDKVDIGIFIDEPYYRYINSGTLFWNVSGFDFKMGTTGAELRMESLTTLISGGIAFDTPADQTDKTVSPPGTLFDLFPSYASSRTKRYQDRLYYTLYFNNSVRGLVEKAPVEYKGIRVGQVEKVSLLMDKSTQDLRIPVLISVEPQRFSESISLDLAPALMENLVAKGMRAKLQSGNFLTGQVFVDLDFSEPDEHIKIARGQFYDVFPTVSQPSLQDLMNTANQVAQDLQRTTASIRQLVDSDEVKKVVKNANSLLVETQTTMQEAQAALADARRVMQTVNAQTLPNFSKDMNQASNSFTRSLNSLTGNVGQMSNNFSQLSATTEKSIQTLTNSWAPTGRDISASSVELNKTLQRLQGSLGHLDRVMAKNSPTQYQLTEMLDELTAMSRAVRTLAESLQRQPESLLRGRQE